MKRILVVLCLLGGLGSVAQEVKAPLRPVATYSIVARDAQTGEIGVAVQSHWFNVGMIVPWAEAGVGAVATQSFVDPSYGKLGLELMRTGKSARDTLRGLLMADHGRAVRQVAMIDAKGDVVAWTGGKDIIAAGHHAGGDNATPEIDRERLPAGYNGRISWGKDYSVQANLMANDKVWPAMARAFEETKGDLAERMLAAMDAAQAVGGDIRGKQSAAMIVVKAKSSGKSWEDRVFDLRVDDHAEPLKELRRLVTLQRAYNHMNAGDIAVEHKDNAGALREYSAAEKLIGTATGIEMSRVAEMKYWHAVALVNMGRVEQALPLFKQAFELHPAWRELTPRLPKSELLPNDPKLIERIVGVK